MKFTVEPFHFEELIKKSYSLDHIFLLRMVNEQEDISEMLASSVKISAIHQGLIRKGLIVESGDKVTQVGIDLLEFMNSKTGRKITKRKVEVEGFDEWWQHFPSTNTFVYKGKEFPGDRAMRVKKDECRLKFNNIILEGEYSIKDLIDAIDYEVLQKKESSLRTGVNKLTYIHNSLTYLNQRDFEPFIELMRSGNKITESQSYYSGSGGVDI